MRELKKSAVWALAISIPVSLLGMVGTWWLIHSRSIITFIPFLPAIGVFKLFGSKGPFQYLPGAVIVTLLFIAQYLGYFIVIHAGRTIYQKIYRSKEKHI